MTRMTRMPRRLMAGSVVCGALVLTGGARVSSIQGPQTPEAVLGAAIHQEEAEGNLEAAIESYQTFLDQYGDNRPLAVQALLRLGQAYEALGRPEARNAYERVLREFADQAESATTARTRLAALTQLASSANAATMVTRRVWRRTGGGLGGSLTPDGRFLTFTDWTTGGDLAVRELATGTIRRLTDQRSTPEYHYAWSSAPSPNGRQVVFQWFDGDDRYEVRTVGFEGSEPRVLYADEEVRYPIPFRWSPDGTQILALFPRKDGTYQIVLIAVDDGSVRVLKTLGWHEPTGMSFSPDGRFIAYAVPPDPDTEEHDIFVLAADGSREIPLVQDPANDVFPTWTPDGQYVLFHSDRTGAMGAWVTKVADSRPVGPPTLIKPDIGRSEPLGFTPEGSYYYVVDAGTRDIFTAEIDPGTGELLTPPAKAVEHFTGSNDSPAWSPDGRSLAYISQRSAVPPTWVIAIRSLKTGEERELSLNLSSLGAFHQLRWSPDGESLLMSGTDETNRVGLYRIDAHRGKVTAIAQNDKRYIGSVWSRDGRSVMYSTGVAIYNRDLESGRVRDLYSGEAPIFRLSLSPDGRHLAFMSDEDGLSLKVMPVGGGDARTVFTDASIEWVNGALAWTPDGSQLLFGKGQPFEARYEQTALWRIPIDPDFQYGCGTVSPGPVAAP